jgi:16S rRNA G966 N2-methylase RsmD
MAVFLDPPYRDYEARGPQMKQLLANLVEKLPEGSLIAAEAGRGLDDDMLPDRELWDVRHYGETRIAIRLLSGHALGSTVAVGEATGIGASGRRVEDGDA